MQYIKRIESGRSAYEAGEYFASIKEFELAAELYVIENPKAANLDFLEILLELIRVWRRVRWVKTTDIAHASEHARAAEMRVVELLNSASPVSEEMHATAWESIARCAYSYDRLEEARSHYERAVGILEKCREVEQARVIDARLFLIDALRRLSRLSEALELSIINYQATRSGEESEWSRSATTATLRGQILLELGRHDEARPFLREALETVRGRSRGMTKELEVLLAECDSHDKD